MVDEALSVETWLKKVVVGLNLCPFAAYPVQHGRVRCVVTRALTEEDLLNALHQECLHLQSVNPAEIETTLMVVADGLKDFFDYTQFVQWANAHIKREGWQGIFQLATFHPDYCFMGAAPEDRENLTNRSPYPVIHIIREASLEKAISFYDGDVDEIPEINKKKVASLEVDELKKLFPYVNNLF